MKKDSTLSEFYKEKEQEKPIKLENLAKIEKLKNFDYVQTEEEKQLYEKFCDIANADPDEKFKFDHLNKLGVPFDVGLIYGKKGIGKTYQISTIIRELTEKDPKAQVILMRNTISEFSALEKQLSTSYSPITLKGRTTNNPTLWHKELLVNGKPRYIGFCVALNGFALEASKGAEFENVRLIIWDECTNVGTSTSYDSGDIARFVTFLDSIIRNKKNVKIYIFGNFHRNTSGKVSDVLLDTLRIPYGCTLKKRTVLSKDAKNTSTFLYVNTGSLYSGIDSNAKIALFSDQIQEDLYFNMPKSYSSKVGGLNLFYSHTPEWGLLFNDGIQTYILLLSSYKEIKEDFTIVKNWMLHMEEFPTDNAFAHEILTSDIALYNEYEKDWDVSIISQQEERLNIHDLYEICLNKSLYYSGDVSRELFRKQMSKWQEEHDLGITISFFPTKRKSAEGF